MRQRRKQSERRPNFDHERKEGHECESHIARIDPTNRQGREEHGLGIGWDRRASPQREEAFAHIVELRIEARLHLGSCVLATCLEIDQFAPRNPAVEHSFQAWPTDGQHQHVH
jgi:hypothetical protein